MKHFECQICKGNLEKKFKNSLEIKNNPLSLHPLSARFFSRLMRVKKNKRKVCRNKNTHYLCNPNSTKNVL